MAIQFLNGLESLGGTITITKATTAPLMYLYNTTNGAGATIRFSDQSTPLQTGDITYFHQDGSSQGGGASFNFRGESDTTLVVGDSTGSGRFVSKSAGNAAEVDYGFYDDVNTGMYRTSADNVSLVAGGIAGVGVGTTAVSLKYAGATKIATSNTGVTVTGGIVLSGTGRIQGIDTVSATTDAANKTYVDSAVAGVPLGNYLPLAGGTLTGALAGTTATFAGDITSAGLTVDYTGNRTGDAGILVTNDGSDWGIKVDKDGTTDYGILSQTDGENAIVVRNAAGVNKIQLQGDGDATFVGDVTVSGGDITLGGTGRIQGVDTVSATTDAANKAYVDAGDVRVTPATPSTITSSVVGETIEIAFNQSATSNIDYYQVWSSDDGGDYGIIAQVTPADFSSTMTVVDTTFVTGGTMSYRIFAVREGIYSTAGTTSQSYTVGALDVFNMTVVNLNTAYYIQYEKPTTRFIDHIEIYMDSQTTSAALNRSNATIVYSGQNSSYMRNVNASNNFHQFWVEIVTS